MGKEYDLISLINSLRYLAVFEKKTSSLYEDIAEKVESPLAKALLQSISLDCRKHAISLKGIDLSMPKNDVHLDMPKSMKEACLSIDGFQIELSKVDRIEAAQMTELCAQLANLEDSLAAEYESLLVFNILDLLHKQLNKSYRIDFETLKLILLGAQRDEGYHREILATVTELLKREKEPEIDNTPAVAFRNPDGWNRPG